MPHQAEKKAPGEEKPGRDANATQTLQEVQGDPFAFEQGTGFAHHFGNADALLEVVTIHVVERQLSDEVFLGKAPAKVVDSIRVKLAEYEAQLAKLTAL